MVHGMTRFTRRRILGAAGVSLGGLVLLGLWPAQAALADGDWPLKFFKTVADPQNATPLEKEHLVTIRLPVIAEDGANVPVTVSLEHHPMDPDHYIKSLQILNFNDPVIGKGIYLLSPANGQAFISTQIRSDGGNAEVYAIAECTKHGKWYAKKTFKVSLGGC